MCPHKKIKKTDPPNKMMKKIDDHYDAQKWDFSVHPITCISGKIQLKDLEEFLRLPVSGRSVSQQTT